jgi:hypothetical protein
MQYICNTQINCSEARPRLSKEMSRANEYFLSFSRQQQTTTMTASFFRIRCLHVLLFSFDYLKVLDNVALNRDVRAGCDRVSTLGAMPLTQQLLKDGQYCQIIGEVGRRHVVVDVLLFDFGRHASQCRGTFHAHIRRTLHETVRGCFCASTGVCWHNRLLAAAARSVPKGRRRRSTPRTLRN